MANTLRFKRGLASGIPTGVAGEPLFTTDTFDLYIGNGTNNTRFQKYIASGTTSQLLRGDGSLLTMPIVLTSPATGQVLKFNGTNWVNDSDAGITGSLTTNYLPKATGATTLGNSLVFDNGTNVLVNTTTALWSASARQTFEVNGGSQTLIALNVGNTSAGYLWHSGTYLSLANTRNSYLSFVTNSAEVGRFHASGNFGIGTGATDSGQRLQVTGDTLLRGSGNTSATTALTVQNSDGNGLLTMANDGTLNFGNLQTGGLRYRFTNNLISYTNGTTAQPLSFTVGPLSFPSNVIGIKSSVTGSTYHNLIIGGDWVINFSADTSSIFAGTTFSPTSSNARFYSLLAQPAINQTGGANGITRGLYINPTLTAAADWRSIEWSNNSGWGLYGAGTAANYLNGDLRVNETGARNAIIFASTTGKTNVVGIRVGGDATQGTSFGFFSNQTINSANNTEYTSFNSNTDIASGTYTIPIVTSYRAQSNTKPVNVTITNMYGFFAESGLIQGTNNYGFFGNIASGTGRWNLFMSGTALNYLNGSLLIGSTSDSGEKLQVTGTAKITGASTFGSSITAASANINGLTYIRHNGTGFYNELLFLRSDISSPVLINFQNTANSHAFGFSSTGTQRFVFINGGNTEIASISNLGAATFSSSVTAASGIITGNLTVDTNTLFVDATNNRVGVGTITPLVDLQVQKSSLPEIRVTDGTIGYQMYSTTGGDNFVVGTFTNHALVFRTNSTERMRLDANGNLGLGVTPSAWESVTRAFQIGNSGSLSSNTSDFRTSVGSNFFINTAGTTTYLNTGFASQYMQISGTHRWFNAPSGTAGNAITFTQAMTLTAAGRLLLGTTTEGTNLLDVNGTARITGILAVGGTATFLNPSSVNIVGTDTLVGATARNTSSASGDTQCGFYVENGTSNGQLYKAGTGYTTRKTIAANDLGFYNAAAGNISILNDFASGSIILTAGGSSTAQWTIGANGDLTAADGENIIVGSTNGTKLGTATTQKIGFWNATPIVQPNNSVAAATHVSGIGTAVTTLDAFDGYTIGQVVKALRNAGILS